MAPAAAVAAEKPKAKNWQKKVNAMSKQVALLIEQNAELKKQLNTQSQVDAVSAATSKLLTKKPLARGTGPKRKVSLCAVRPCVKFRLREASILASSSSFFAIPHS